jgi:aldose 1-epimerase
MIDTEPWGAVDGRAVSLFTMTNANGLVTRITNYGATVVELHVPDRHGRLGDVALGFDTLDDYVRMPGYFGATVGRVGNRIAGAAFELDGRRYALYANHGANHLHGGRVGWDKRVWRAEPTETPEGPSLTFDLQSPDGEEGYPGTVTATTRYTLTDANELAIEMTATTDRTTIVNMVHHTYFNLRGADGDVLGHELQLFADAYTPGMPPDGRVVPVRGTPFDFTASKPIGRDHQAAGSAGGGAPAGYDSNWIVSGDPRALRPVARLFEPNSGRLMTVRANQPGVQFYSGVFLDGTTGGKGRRYTLSSGLCLEPQAFPNAINIPEWRDQMVLEPARSYRHEVVFGFAIG